MSQNRERALDIVHALSVYLTVRLLARDGTISNPEEAMDGAETELVSAIEKGLNEVARDAVEP